MRKGWILILALTFGRSASGAEGPDAWGAWPPAARAAQERFEAALAAVPSPARLRAWHDLFCAEPHPAGSPGERRLAERMEEALRAMGLDVAREPFHALLPVHEEARVAVEVGGAVHVLPLHERPLAQDSSVARDVPVAFCAWSGSGEARGEVVYANHGTREDFARLAGLGVTVRGKIVVARYGRNFRGYKAKYAEAAGAAGLLIYTDPEDAGYRKGLPYPEGGWANETSVQRGAVLTLPYAGDPLTPFEPATEDAKRLEIDGLALPSIPVHPIGWEAASAILGRMKGRRVPDDWQGGLPFAYRLEGGPGLAVRLTVRQPRRVLPSANVIARIEGATWPEQWVVVGCHFDAWTFGAGDPHAGSIVLFEMARSFAEAVEAGHRPARTVIFANWAAEEYGIVGSTEFCEAHRAHLAAHGVAYVNLDMAAMGPDVHASASPVLARLIEDAARATPQARAAGTTVHEAWSARSRGTPFIGDLGGGSDHVGFLCHLGIPAASLGAGGSDGVSYHSAYDTLAWYRKVVGEDYEPARMLARLGNVLVARLANAPLVPYDLPRAIAVLRRHLEGLSDRPGGREVLAACADLGAVLDVAEREAAEVQARLERKAAAGELTPGMLREIGARLVALERLWLDERGLPGRPWYRNVLAAPDPWSGYAAWMLPLLRHAAEGDPGDPGPEPAAAAAVYARAVRAWTDALGEIDPEPRLR